MHQSGDSTPNSQLVLVLTHRCYQWSWLPPCWHLIVVLVNQGEQQLENDSGQHLEQSRNSPSFGPEALQPEDEYTFPAQTVITGNLEKHFRHVLNKTSRSVMHKEHHIPHTPAAKPPWVDKFFKQYLGSHFPSNEDRQLTKVQSAIIRACGPMTSLWSELVDSGIPTPWWMPTIPWK